MIKNKFNLKQKIAVTLAALIAVAFFMSIKLITFKKYPANFNAVKVSQQDLQMSILSTGVVQPQNRLDIKPPINGRIDEVLVVEGQSVKRGQVLAWMSSTERASLLDAARSEGSDSLKQWEEYYKPTSITAPIDGTIIYRNVEAGQTFTDEDPVLVMSNHLTIKVQVDETDIAKIKIKQPVTVTLDAYPDEPFAAHVEKIAYDAKTINNVTTYIVDVLPDSTPSFMKSGMTANASFYLEKIPQVLVLPIQAIRRKTGKVFVYVKHPQNSEQVIERVITVGETDGKMVVVKSGLDLDEEVYIPTAKKELTEKKALF